jgi:hypothetical protein
MADMKKDKSKLTEDEIDEIVIRQADDPSAWGKLVHVKAMSVVPIPLSPRLIEKAKVIARRRRMKGYQAWMQRVIQERIKLEANVIRPTRFSRKSNPVAK